MSLLYFWEFVIRPFFGWSSIGNFELGRLVDLLQRDLIIAFLIWCGCYLRRIVICERQRWDYILKKEKENE